MKNKPHSVCRRARGLYLQLLCSFHAHQRNKQPGLVLSTRRLLVKPLITSDNNNNDNNNNYNNKLSIMALVSGSGKARPVGVGGGQGQG